MNEVVKATLLYYIYGILPITASTPLPYMSVASSDQLELLYTELSDTPTIYE